MSKLLFRRFCIGVGLPSVGLGADELRQILSWSVFDGIPGIFGELRVLCGWYFLVLNTSR